MKAQPKPINAAGDTTKSSPEKDFRSAELLNQPSGTDEATTPKTSSRHQTPVEGAKPNRRHKAKHGADCEKVQKRAHQLEQQLHLTDLSQKVRNSLWCSPLVFQMIGLIADQLGISKGDVVHTAVIMFHRQCFSDERRMVSDLGMLLKNLECQVEELGMEIESLEETALTAVELELSPYHGSQNFDQ